MVVWEAVNPVSLMHRAIIFGGVVAWGGVAAVFLFDLLIAPRGWCGHVCPMGAAYKLIGKGSLLRVSAQHSSKCNDCADCYAVCPEPHIIPIPLKGKAGALPVIHISPFWQQAISGFVILVAVIVNARSERRAGKQILPPKGAAAASSNNHRAQLQGSKS